MSREPLGSVAQSETERWRTHSEFYFEREQNCSLHTVRNQFLNPEYFSSTFWFDAFFIFEYSFMYTAFFIYLHVHMYVNDLLFSSTASLPVSDDGFWKGAVCWLSVWSDLTLFYHQTCEGPVFDLCPSTVFAATWSHIWQRCIPTWGTETTSSRTAHPRSKRTTGAPQLHICGSQHHQHPLEHTSISTSTCTSTSPR